MTNETLPEIKARLTQLVLASGDAIKIDVMTDIDLELGANDIVDYAQIRTDLTIGKDGNQMNVSLDFIYKSTTGMRLLYTEYGYQIGADIPNIRKTIGYNATV